MSEKRKNQKKLKEKSELPLTMKTEMGYNFVNDKMNDIDNDESRRQK